jgi:hypothetical protein
MVMAGDQSAGRSDNIKTDNSCFEGRNSSNVWEQQPEQIKLLFSKKLTADCSQAMLAVIWCRAFCVTVCCTKI